MISLEELILKEEDEIDKKVIDVKSANNGDKKEDNNVKIRISRPQKLKQI